MKNFKPVEERKEPDLEEVLDAAGRQEQNWIEYKSSGVVNDKDRFREKLAKALSAFGNRTEGGYFVIGVKGGTAGKPAEIDGGVSVTHKQHGTKEWLGQLIPGLTDKHSPDCRVGQVERADDRGKIKEGHALFIVEIPPNSDMPVRSVIDKEFYYRKDTHSERLDMQQVLDIIHRRTTPRVTIAKIECSLDKAYPADRNRNEHAISLRVILTNCSNKVALHSALDVLLPHWLFHGQRQGYRGWDTVGMHRLEKRYSVSTSRLDIEVFPRQSVKLPALDLVAGIRLAETDSSRTQTPLVPLEVLDCPEIGFVIYADDAPPTAWKLRVDRSPVVAGILAEILESYDSALPLGEEVRRFSSKTRVFHVEDAIREHLCIPVKAADLTDLGADGAS
jgi:hypothetical protein